MKYWRSLAIGIGAMLCALPPLAAQAQGKLEKPQVSIAVGGKSQFYYLPLTIAERLGYFKDEGLEVEISDFDGGSKALQAVVGGSADVVAGAWENTIDQQPKGLRLQGFVLLGRYPAISVGIAKAKAASYQSPKDLKGMKIGVTAPGSSTNRVILHLLAKDGLKGDDVAIIGVGTSSGAIAAMRSGSLDAMSNVDPIMTMLESSGDVVIIADTRTAAGTMAHLAMCSAQPRRARTNGRSYFRYDAGELEAGQHIGQRAAPGHQRFGLEHVAGATIDTGQRLAEHAHVPGRR
jgi:NitT/TauT family transport system substrate-binding protein